MTADDAAGATILLVEDDDATRTFLADNLTADGFELLVADCARDARRLLETKYPDLVVLDVGLPDGSGLDLLRAVREADGVASRIDPRVAVLVLSARAGELDRVRGFDRTRALGPTRRCIQPESGPRHGGSARELEPLERSMTAPTRWESNSS